MRKPQIVIKLERTDYKGYAALGKAVVAALTGNISFGTPGIPLATLSTAISDVDAAMTLWNFGDNRGSHANLADLQNKTLTLANLLRAEADYVQTESASTAGNDYSIMNAIMTTSGFQLKRIGSPQGILEAVQNFHRFISRSLAPNQVKLKWEKPLNLTSKNNVRSYKVLRGTTNVFSAAVEIGSPTATSFIDTNDTAAMQTWYYWIVAVNSYGDSAPSDVVSVAVVPN